MQSATDLLRSHYAAQHTPEQKQTTRQYTLYAACLGLHTAQTRGRVCAGRPAGREGGRREGRERYLALGGVAVEARLGRPVAPALAVVHVHGEVEVEQVAFHDMRLRGLGEHGGDGRC